MSDDIVERLQARITKITGYMANNDRVLELMQPELDRFKARDGHNIYATRLAVDHQSSNRSLAKELADWTEAAATIARLKAELDEAREALRKANSASWFYYGDNCESDRCRTDIGECISEDFEWDNKPEGDHVLLISGARPVPDMWVALHYYTEDEKDERDSDDEHTFTVHASKEEAELAIRAMKEHPSHD